MGIRDRLRARVKRLVKGDEAPDSRATRDRASVTPVDVPSAPPVDASAGPRIQPEPLSAPATPRTGVPASPEPASVPSPPPPAHAAAPTKPAVPPAAPVPAPSPAPAPAALAAVFVDDHATSDAPIRNAHYADEFETTAAALTVRVYSVAEGIDITFPCEPGEYVLDAAERAGHELPFSCRGGGCLVCAGRLDTGTVEMDEQYVLDEEHIADRFRLLCCTTVSTDAVFESHLEDAVD